MKFGWPRHAKDAEKTFDHFAGKYGAKYDKAVTCLAKDRNELLAFYDFPAEHWKHIRTTNPIESTFCQRASAHERLPVTRQDADYGVQTAQGR